MAEFHAEGRGYGRVSVADREPSTAVEDVVRLESQLREAILTGSLVLHFQPILTRNGSAVMAQALVRWPHPERGMLSPGVIMPLAEQGDLLRELDVWVLHTALREAARWPSGQHIAVNLAGLVPGDPDFVDEIEAAITESGIEHHRVVLEMTETALVDLTVAPCKAMAELATRGVRFAIDDFGTGYSSLTRLKYLPAHILKLDRAFIADVETSTIDHAIVKAVAELAHAVGHICVAEGVETAGQLDVLDGLGVDLYQGFLFSYPVPVGQFRATHADWGNTES